MDSKTRLFVFAKKEVALIFIFMILIAITSFVFGVKVGKNYSLELSGVTEEDRKKVVELLSKNEEDLQEIKKNQEAHTVESADIEHKLQEKISNEFGTGENHSAPNMSTEHGATSAHEPVASVENKSDGLSGKFTIQLGSHRTLKEAEDFAEDWVL